LGPLEQVESLGVLQGHVRERALKTTRDGVAHSLFFSGRAAFIQRGAKDSKGIQPGEEGGSPRRRGGPRNKPRAARGRVQEQRGAWDPVGTCRGATAGKARKGEGREVREDVVESAVFDRDSMMDGGGGPRW
jgi:hypothetical protein